jgi:hypothetical protein
MKKDAELSLRGAVYAYDEGAQANNDMKRTTNEVQAELAQARRAFDNYNNVQFEGHGTPDNYYLNPHHKAIEALAAELYEIEQAAKAIKLSGDSLQAERAWFNGQGFTRPDLAQKACQARGYQMSDLFAAIKAAK